MMHTPATMRAQQLDFLRSQKAKIEQLIMISKLTESASVQQPQNGANPLQS